MGTTVATASSGSDNAAADLVAGLREGLGGNSPALVMAFSSTKQDLGGVLTALGSAFDGAKVMGCTTAGEFTEVGDTKSTVSAVAVAGDFVVHAGMAGGLKDNPDGCLDAALAGLPRQVDGYDHCTALLLLDPLSGTGEMATLLAAQKLGFTVPLAGGAAGDDLNFAKAVVGLGGDVANDSAVVGLIFSKSKLGVGICHGHTPIGASTGTVTKAEGATVYEVDNRPAWDVWTERTREAAAKAGIDVDQLTEADEIGAYLLRFEAGLAVGDGDYKIRAPLTKGEDGSISFACGIPQGAQFEFTESVPVRQVESAVEAAKRAKSAMGGGDVAGAIVFDCICRNLILSDQFADAVTGMSDALGGVPLAGFETYGEIALDVGDMSGFHNTTTVVLAFPQA